MKKPVVVFDVDGVLLDYETSFVKHMIDGPVVDPAGTDFDSRYGIDREEISKLIWTFNHAHDQFTKLDPLPGAVEAVNYLNEMGYDIHCITACGDLPACVSGRRDNLEKVFGKDAFKSVVYRPLYGDKKEALQALFDQYGDGVYFDDSLRHVETADEIGYHSAWVLTDYNPPFHRQYAQKHREENMHYNIHTKVTTKSMLSLTMVIPQ